MALAVHIKSNPDDIVHSRMSIWFHDDRLQDAIASAERWKAIENAYDVIIVRNSDELGE